MDPPEVRIRQPQLQSRQHLRREIFRFARDDPDDIALGLESQNFVRVEEEVLLRQFTDDPSWHWSRTRISDFLELHELLRGLQTRNTLSPFHRFREPLLADRFQ